MKAKYLIILSRGLELPVVFNPIIDHSQMAGNATVVSAGFCSKGDNGQFSTWGGSVSLKMQSREGDADILNKRLQIEV